MFIPDTMLTGSAPYIAFNHSKPGHYDATKIMFTRCRYRAKTA